ncbi:uroporphyrinogen decarboxylase [Luteimicrobium subarcticum]|uniref:uroporphyrinogen decarboxylase n=1 Tax=Luteimicrobium subarcticum TaxID=620910 RepID=UPI001B7FFDBE|nr:uroporphyrinogen decarboxylase [Luteimicrobium subarcticum]
MTPTVNPTKHLPADHPLVDGRTTDAPLVRALRGDRPATLPVWFMRQAGRSLPEYRAAREGTTMLGSCLDPALASEITLQPVRRHGVDAAVFYSDIVVPLLLAGVDVEIQPGVGPVMGQAYATADDVARLVEHELTLDALAPVSEGVARTVAALGSTPLMGFAGAPFTLAAYLVEGRPSRDHLAARTLMHADPDTWFRLVEWAADVTGTFLRAQVLAGASAGQLFDSWAGSLSLDDYSRYALPASSRALTHVTDLVTPPAPDAARDAGAQAGGAPRGIPLVHFGTGTGHLLEAMRHAGAGALGVDYRTPLDEAAKLLGGTTPLQGNIDPALLFAPWPVLEAHVRDVVERGRYAPGHVVNLGHGVPPTTDPTVLTRVVELVHSL